MPSSTLVVRESRRVSSTANAMSGLGRTRAWTTPPCKASASLAAAASAGLPAAAIASADSRVSGPPAAGTWSRMGIGTGSGRGWATTMGLDKTAASPSGHRSLRIELHLENGSVNSARRK